jgi:hypothetical protein
MLFFMAIGGAAFYRYLMAGIYRLEASEGGVRRSNEAFKGATLGILGVFLMFLIFFTFNRDMLLSDVGLDALRTTSPSVKTTSGGTLASGSGGSPTCSSVGDTISKLGSPSGVCGGTSCTVLSGCNYSQYLPIIEREAGALNVDPEIVVVIMCKESRAKADAQNKNPNGSFDCGLMQVNQPLPCDSSSLNPEQNIKKGVALLKQKSGAVNQSYSGIPQRMGVFASYNCCANGTVPHSVSADCTTSNGFPFSIPKWACPINPGEGSFNMCSVKNYVCELESCLGTLNL